MTEGNQGIGQRDLTDAEWELLTGSYSERIRRRTERQERCKRQRKQKRAWHRPSLLSPPQPPQASNG